MFILSVFDVHFFCSSWEKQLIACRAKGGLLPSVLCLLPSGAYCEDVSFSVSKRSSWDGGDWSVGTTGGSKAGDVASGGMVCKAGAGLAAFGLDGGSFTGKPFSSNNSPLRVNT